MTEDIAALQVVSVATIRRFAGKLNFLAGVVPTIRPVLWPLWAVLAPSQSPGADDAARALGLLSSSGDRKRSGYWVHVRRLRRCIAWLRAYWSLQAGALTREVPLDDPPVGFCISTDASPWGIGAILQSPAGDIVAYFTDALTSEDERQLRARIGVPDHQSVWELLAMVVALKAWKHVFAHAGVFRLRADSMAALSALHKQASMSGAMNKLLLILSLHEAELVGGASVLEHVPGLVNVLPDTLSRLAAPDPPSMPAALVGVPRTAVQRDASFWLT